MDYKEIIELISTALIAILCAIKAHDKLPKKTEEEKTEKKLKKLNKKLEKINKKIKE